MLNEFYGGPNLTRHYLFYSVRTQRNYNYATLTTQFCQVWYESRKSFCSDPFRWNDKLVLRAFENNLEDYPNPRTKITKKKGTLNESHHTIHICRSDRQTANTHGGIVSPQADGEMLEGVGGSFSAGSA